MCGKVIRAERLFDLPKIPTITYETLSENSRGLQGVD